ncbi:magnesium transporter MgtE N-terminal domain-containing protein [Phycisphaerales bacterium AB-hyl4]|uniref:Magnesium transporter MgtE N-terminal domain-containing protein n=1 Tax=Natronomicrosphaera hydrolytica TaxID=3242702 RepID=A0ABV4UA64_9BACT
MGPQSLKGASAEPMLYAQHQSPCLNEAFDNREVATLLEHVAADDRMDLIQELPPEQQRAILAEMAEPERRETERLLTHLGLEVGVTAISWEVAQTHDEELSSS